VAIKDRLLEGQVFCYIGNCLKATVQPEKAIECYKRVSFSVILHCFESGILTTSCYDNILVKGGIPGSVGNCLPAAL